MAGLKLIAPESVGSGRGTQQVRFATGDSLEQTGRAGLVFTDKLNDIAESELALKRLSDVADSHSAFVNDLDRKRVELASDPDVAGREAKLQTYANERFAQLTEGMDAKTAARFKASANPVADTMATTVRHQARTDLVEKAIVSLRDGNDLLVAKAGDARNPNERQSLIDTMNANLQGAFEAGFLTPAQLAQEKKNTLTKVDQAEALRLIRDNPGGTAAMLAKSDFLPNLDPVARQNLIDKAGNEVLRRVSLANAQEARAERQEARTAAKLADEYGKELEVRASDGTLTREWLDRSRTYLSKADLNVGLKVLKGGATVDSKDALSVLVPRLDQQDISKDLTDALLKDQITHGTYVTLSNRNREALKDDQPASPYKRGRGLISDALNPSTMFDSASAKITGYARAGALDEYDTFVEANRDAIKKNPQLALDRARDIQQRYQLINFNEIGSAIGLPQGYGGTRETIQADDIRQAGQRVLQLFDGGRMSEAEKVLELRKLQAWDEIIKQRDSANAPRAPQKPKPLGGGEGR